MAIIQFPNGQKVNFDGNPSPQDIDHVAGTLGINSSNQNPTLLNKVSNAVGDVGDFLGNAVKNTVAAPATLAMRAGELGGVGVAGAASKITGDPGYYNRAINALNQPTKVPGAEVPIKGVSQETPESIAGEGVSTVALGLPNPTAAGAAIGGGNALQNNQGPLSVGLQTGGGAILGNILGRISNAAFPKAVSPEDTLINSGAATDVEAPTLSKVFQNAGGGDITDPTERAVLSNRLQNTASNLTDQIQNFHPDPISGEFTSGQNEMIANLKTIQAAQNALKQVASVPAAPEAQPGLLQRGLKAAGKDALSALKYAGIIGASTIGASQAEDPKSIVHKVLSSGGL